MTKLLTGVLPLLLSGACASSADAALKYIIVKADDLIDRNAYNVPDGFGNGWTSFFETVDSEGIKVNLGVNGDRCPSDYNDPFWVTVRNKLDTGRYEIFNHGYEHVRFPEQSDARKRTLIRDNQELVRQMTGQTMIGLGLPENRHDQATANVVAEFSDLKVWIYGRDLPGRLNLARDGELEFPGGLGMHAASFKAEFAGYKAKAEGAGRDYLCLQMHPANLYGNDARKSSFREVVQFLKGQGLQFVTLSEYYGFATGTPAGDVDRIANVTYPTSVPRTGPVTGSVQYETAGRRRIKFMVFDSGWDFKGIETREVEGAGTETLTLSSYDSVDSGTAIVLVTLSTLGDEELDREHSEGIPVGGPGGGSDEISDVDYPSVLPETGPAVGSVSYTVSQTRRLKVMVFDSGWSFRGIDQRDISGSGMIDFSISDYPEIGSSTGILKVKVESLEDGSEVAAEYMEGITVSDGGGGAVEPEIEIDSWTAAANSGANISPGWGVGGFNAGDWLRYDGINMRSGYAVFSVQIASGRDGELVLRRGGANGRALASVPFDTTGGWNTFEWIAVEMDPAAASGTHDLFLTVARGSANVKALALTDY